MNETVREKTMKRAEVSKVTAFALAGALSMTSGLAVAQQAPPVDFGDLIILYRDANGVPILTPGDPGPGGTGLCQQPIYFASDLCPTTCAVASVPAAVDVVDVDQTTCAVVVGCEACTQEVEFGRINEARSPDTVFDSQLQDVVVNLATSDCVVTLDPAGRMVTGTLVLDNPDPEPDVFSTSAIDSPLQNLAIYRQLIQTGSLGVPLAQGAGVLDTAARGLGAASDKAGEVNVDLVAYLNQIMGLSDPATTTILDPKICIQVREEVQGVVQLVPECFLDYGAYGYDREANFGALPAPPYIPEATPTPGWFEYLVTLDPTVPTFTVEQGPITTAVFAGLGFLGDNIGGFAQASDDARAVIDFMHSWQVPAEFETVVPCEPLTAVTYDVSISPVSGLQVPRNIVSGTEGREFTVTVANAGPDPATGTVTVTANVATGGVVPGSPWAFTFTDLQAGLSASFTQLFSVTVPQATTINWTAIVEASFDVNPANNSVSATSNVRVTGGGGGGPGGG